MLYGTKILPILSDPTSVDGDGDGISDYDETVGVSYDNPNGTTDEYEGAPLNKGLAGGIIGKLTIVSHDPDGFGHSFLLYESYINDTLDLSGLAAGFEYIKNDGDDSDRNNWKKIYPCEYKISPNRYISIGNFVDNGAGGSAGASSGSSGSGFSGSSSQSGSSGSSQSGSSGGSSIGSSQSSAAGDASDASAGIHFNVELNLLYDDNDGDGQYDRLYGDNYALDHAIIEGQLAKAIEYWNSEQHYNFITNNCAEVASKTWEKAFGEHLSGRMILGVFTPNPLKKSISKHENSYVINFRSDEWTNILNKEVVNW
jgi:hypothetical protein